MDQKEKALKACIYNLNCINEAFAAGEDIDESHYDDIKAEVLNVMDSCRTYDEEEMATRKKEIEESSLVYRPKFFEHIDFGKVFEELISE
jgi:hypothetical protein